MSSIRTWCLQKKKKNSGRAHRSRGRGRGARRRASATGTRILSLAAAWAASAPRRGRARLLNSFFSRSARRKPNRIRRACSLAPLLPTNSAVGVLCAAPSARVFWHVQFCGFGPLAVLGVHPCIYGVAVERRGRHVGLGRLATVAPPLAGSFDFLDVFERPGGWVTPADVPNRQLATQSANISLGYS